MGETTTIRVPTETRDRLNELARRRGAPAGDVVTALVAEADDRLLLAAAFEAWERTAGVLSRELRQGDVVWADPGPTRGSEPAESGPFVVVSVDQLNRSQLGLSLAVPLRGKDFSNVLHVEITPPEGGLRERSFAMPEQLQTLSHERVGRQLGALRPATLTELLHRCRLLLLESA